MPANIGDDGIIHGPLVAADGTDVPNSPVDDSPTSTAIPESVANSGVLGDRVLGDGALGEGAGGPEAQDIDDRELEASESEADSSEIDEEEAGFVKGLMEWAVVLVGAVVVALVLRAFLFQAFWIPSESMESTLMIQDRVLVNKISYDLHDVYRGDVVVFERPDDQPGEIRDLIKRVIGIAGESVEGRDNAVWIDGERLIEPYLEAGVVISDFGPVEVPEGHVFVMGDNRDQSFDSRFFGTVSTDRIVGRAFVLFWPFGRAGVL